MSEEMYAHVNVKILEKEYQISCPADERKALVDSAELLNAKMREIRDSGKVVGLDRIAVMAALNMANDLIMANGVGMRLESEAKGKLRAMRERVESALQSGQQLEL
jgi:cell division protein ZapA